MRPHSRRCSVASGLSGSHRVAIATGSISKEARSARRAGVSSKVLVRVVTVFIVVHFRLLRKGVGDVVVVGVVIGEFVDDGEATSCRWTSRAPRRPPPHPPQRTILVPRRPRPSHRRRRRHQIGFYEAGKITPNTDTIIRIAETFNVSIDYLLVDTTDRRSLHDPATGIDNRLDAIAQLSDGDTAAINNVIDALTTRARLRLIIN